MQISTWSILAFVFLSGLLSGCSAATTSVETPLPLTKSAKPAASEMVESRRSLQEGAIEYSRTGGIAGISERWSLFADGRVIDAQGVEYEVSETEIAVLYDEIEALGFYDWEVGPRRLGSCADCFTYTISVHHDGQSNQLSFVDGQADAPEGIWIILDRIQAILNAITEDEAD